VVSSESDVQEAIGEIEVRKALMQPVIAEIAALKEAVDAYVEKKGNIETDTHKLTRVQGFTRKWNVDKLKKIVPKGIFLQLCNLTPDPDKIDQAVRAGRLDAKKIAPAFEETPKAAYVKWTEKKESNSARQEEQADALAANLGT
jgi:hypothetical protein